MKQIIVISLLCILSGSFATLAQNRGGTVTASSMVVTRTKLPSNIRWQNSIEATVSDFYSLSYIGGWRFSNALFFGFGTGLQVFPNLLHWDTDDSLFNSELEELQKLDKSKYYSPSRIALPVYAHVKFRFLKTKISPYLSASGGLLIGSSGSEDVTGVYYADCFVGVDFKLKEKSSIALGLGPIWNGQETILEENGYSGGGYKLVYSF